MLPAASPKDICRFLAWKDKGGKTQVHASNCLYLGKHGFHKCGCPTRVSHRTVDTLIGKLRAVFKEVGRDGDWNSAFGDGNPAASNEVKCYLKAVTSEQLQAAVTPKQATPLFVKTLSALSTHITSKMLEPCISAASLFLLARDDASFKCLFFGRDRTNDLKSQEVLRLPNDQGFLFNQIWGKTLRDCTTNVFAIRASPLQSEYK